MEESWKIGVEKEGTPCSWVVWCRSVLCPWIDVSHCWLLMLAVITDCLELIQQHCEITSQTDKR